MSERALKRIRDWGAETAIILGSGLSSIVGEAAADRVVAFSDFAELPRPFCGRTHWVASYWARSERLELSTRKVVSIFTRVFRRRMLLRRSDAGVSGREAIASNERRWQCESRFCSRIAG